MIGVERGFALEDADGTVTPLAELWDDPGVRMNDGGCDPDGRFYCGSMAYDKHTGGAAIWRLDADRSARLVLDGVTISNGIEWSPDGSLAYYNDTATYCTDVFDYDLRAEMKKAYKTLYNYDLEEGDIDHILFTARQADASNYDRFKAR